MKQIISGNAAVGQWALDKISSGFMQWNPSQMVCIGLVKVHGADDLEILAGVVFTDYNEASMQMHVAAQPGARWMTKAYLGHCFQYAFNTAKVSKLLGFVASGNAAAIRFDENIGFELEARIEHAHPDGALLIYSMTKAQCRYLDIKIPKEAYYGQA